jgi:DNA-binding protein H-NS
MARTYADIQKEIAALQKSAEALRHKEVAGVIERIRTAIQTYGLSAADLGFGSKPAAPLKPAKGRRGAKKKTVSAAMYRDPDSGKTWSGHGRRPGWFVSALAAGKTADELHA